MSSIPLADAGALGRVARRTDLIRFTLAAILVGLVVAIAVLAGHPRVRSLHVLPPGTTGIIVLDLSASISEDTYARISATLADFAASKGRYGLIVFSGTAYQALPPGTPATELKPLIRYFTLPSQKTPGFLPTFPPNPWTNTFSAGTRISSGLELAHTLALQRVSRPAVVLVSDLDDDPSDLGRTALAVLAYRRDRIPLRIVGLNPSPQDVRFFGKLLGKQGTITAAHLPQSTSAVSGSGGFPWLLVALALAAAAALAVNELLLARLEWGERQ
jgi:hypothetical protein